MSNQCKNPLDNPKCEEIGDINNLRFIYWKDNIIKQGDNYYG